MADKDDQDSKVIRLFPARQGAARPAERPPAAQPAVAPDPGVLEKIEGLLDEIEPAPPPRTDRPEPPEPGHRNAVRCPQCDQYTWRMTPHCVHCGADLESIAEERAWRRRRRRALIWNCCVVGSWFVAAGCFYAYNHYYRSLPPKVRAVLMLTALGITGINLLLFWFWSLTGKQR